MAKSWKTAARSTLRAWNGWLWGKDCEPRRARWATFVVAFLARQSRGATLMKELNRQVEATSHHGVSYAQAWNLQRVPGMPQRRWIPTATDTWDSIQHWLRDQIVALHPTVAPPTTASTCQTPSARDSHRSSPRQPILRKMLAQPENSCVRKRRATQRATRQFGTSAHRIVRPLVDS